MPAAGVQGSDQLGESRAHCQTVTADHTRLNQPKSKDTYMRKNLSYAVGVLSWGRGLRQWGSTPTRRPLAFQSNIEAGWLRESARVAFIAGSLSADWPVGGTLGVPGALVAGAVETRSPETPDKAVCHLC